MFKKVLVPLDGSELAEQALPYAKSVAQQYEGEIYLTYVIREDVAALASAELPPSGGNHYVEEAVKQEKQHAEDYLQKHAKSLRGSGISVAMDIREGDAADAIREAVAELGVDLIVMATSGKSGLLRTIRGSVADEIVRESGKPVLLLRGKTE
jgi:nucleotide-binding universal stress UspA family protein